MKPGEVIPADGPPIVINAGRRRVQLRVQNVGDRAVQVGSHYHFFEANRALVFDRRQALGMRLDVPSGTAIRFEPGAEQEVVLVEFGGTRRIIGFAGLVNGALTTAAAVSAAIESAAIRGFKNVST